MYLLASSLTDRATSPHLCHVEPRPFVAADATLPCAPRAYDLEILTRQWVPALAVRLPGVLVAHARDPFTSRPWIPVADLSAALTAWETCSTIAHTSHDAFLSWG